MIHCLRLSVSDGAAIDRRPDCSEATSDAVMPGLRPRLSGSAAPARREEPAATCPRPTLALSGRGIAGATTRPVVMPGLGPGIHELLGAAGTNPPKCGDKRCSSPLPRR